MIKKHSWVPVAALAGLLSAAQSEEPANPVTPLPEKVFRTATQQWKMTKVVERAGAPGAAGQIDLCWEILKIWESNENARREENLLQLMDWLLFEARNWVNPQITDKLAESLPRLAPKLNERLQDLRLAEWLAKLGIGSHERRAEEWVALLELIGSSGQSKPFQEQLKKMSYNRHDVAPWLWANFAAIEKEPIRKAAEQKLAALHNPTAKVWLAAALLACEDPLGAALLAQNSETLKKELPHQAGLVLSAVGESLAKGGIKEGLLILAEQAQQEAANREFARGGSIPPSLQNFYNSLGWIDTVRIQQQYGQQGGGKYKARVDEAKGWLEANLGQVKWDAVLKRFVSTASQPGMERVHRAKVAVEQKWGFTVSEQQLNGHSGRPTAADVIHFMKENAQAAKDSDVEELILALEEWQIILAPDQYYSTLLYQGEPFLKVYELNRGLAVKLCSEYIKRAITSSAKSKRSKYGQNHLASIFQIQQQTGNDELQEAVSNVLPESVAVLKPEFQANYEKVKDLPFAERRHALLSYVLTGGTLETVDFEQLIGEVQDSKVAQLLFPWADAIAKTGNRTGLRLLLNLADGAEQNTAIQSLAAFEYLSGKSKKDPQSAINNLYQLRGEKLKARVNENSQWLTQHEKSLTWNKARRHFTGAPVDAPAAAPADNKTIGQSPPRPPDDF